MVLHKYRYTLKYVNQVFEYMKRYFDCIETKKLFYQPSFDRLLENRSVPTFGVL